MGSELQEEIQVGRRSFALAAEEGIAGAREAVAEAKRLQEELRSVEACRQKRELEVEGLRRRRVEPLQRRNEELREQAKQLNFEYQQVENKCLQEEKQQEEAECRAEHLHSQLHYEELQQADLRPVLEAREIEFAELSSKVAEQARYLREEGEALEKSESNMTAQCEASEKVSKEEDAAMQQMEAESEFYRASAAHDNA